MRLSDLDGGAFREPGKRVDGKWDKEQMGRNIEAARIGRYIWANKVPVGSREVPDVSGFTRIKTGYGAKGGVVRYSIYHNGEDVFVCWWVEGQQRWFRGPNRAELAAVSTEQR